MSHIKCWKKWVSGGCYEYGNPLNDSLKRTCRHQEWKMLLPWKFQSGALPQHYWKNEDNHQLAFDVLRRHIGADKDVEKWYNVTHKMLKEMGLGGCFEHYGNSPQRFLEANMPPSEWKMLLPWKFKSWSAKLLEEWGQSSTCIWCCASYRCR